MENIIVSSYLRLFESLPIRLKLELLASLTDSLKKAYLKEEEPKTTLLNKVAGAWHDMDESIIDDIYLSRTISDRDIQLD